MRSSLTAELQGIRSQRWVQDWLMMYFHINKHGKTKKKKKTKNPGARALAERLIRLARRIRQQLPDTKIYIESMYPAYTKRIGLMPSWAEGKSNKEIQKINTEIQRLCKEDNFEYVDVFDKLIGEDGQLSREYTVDGIHLQENAYDVVATIIYYLMEG